MTLHTETQVDKRELLSMYEQMAVIRRTEKAAYDLFMSGLVKGTTHLAAGHMVTLDSGWRYYNAPLRCDPGPAPTVRLAIGASDTAAPMLVAGWSQIEGSAAWTSGPRSRLRLVLPQGRKAGRIALEGVYFEGVRHSRVGINGVDFGQVVLGPKPLVLPAAAQASGVLDITLEHVLPPPRAQGDQRPLAFMLHAVVLEFAP